MFYNHDNIGKCDSWLCFHLINWRTSNQPSPALVEPVKPHSISVNVRNVSQIHLDFIFYVCVFYVWVLLTRISSVRESQTGLDLEAGRDLLQQLLVFCGP